MGASHVQEELRPATCGTILGPDGVISAGSRRPLQDVVQGVVRGTGDAGLRASEWWDHPTDIYSQGFVPQNILGRGFPTTLRARPRTCPTASLEECRTGSDEKLGNAFGGRVGCLYRQRSLLFGYRLLPRKLCSGGQDQPPKGQGDDPRPARPLENHLNCRLPT